MCDFAQWFESARFESLTSNSDISASSDPTVLIFGGQLRLCSLFMPSKFQADSFSRFRDHFRGVRHFHAPSAYGAA